MGDWIKTDNHDLAGKLALRRHFLGRYHDQADAPIRVFDCCQGDGLIWKELRKDRPNVDYWGVDVKPKSGRLKVDSVRVLAQPGLDRDVIDIDTYGSPWKHWLALLPNVRKPTTVFLTFGSVMIMGRRSMSDEVIASVGATFRRLKLPDALRNGIAEISVGYCLTRSYDFGIILKEVAEVESDGNARYFGVRIEPEPTKWAAAV